MDHLDDYELLIKSIGKVIQKMRTDAGLSQRQLADLALVTPATISFIESGDRAPSQHSLIEISRALETRVSTIFLEAEALMNNERN